MKDKISRREFIIALFAVSGLSFMGGAYINSLRVEEALTKLSNPLQENSIKKIFSEIADSMYLIGKEYVDNKTFNSSNSELIASLNKKLNSQNITTEEFFDIKQRVVGLIRRDFEQNNIIYINNWMFTATEAHLCAIFYLSNFKK